MTTSKYKTIRYDFDYDAGSPIWDEHGSLIGCKAIGLSKDLSIELEHLADEYSDMAWPGQEVDHAWWDYFLRAHDRLLERLLDETEPNGIAVLVYAGPEHSWINAREYLQEFGKH